MKIRKKHNYSIHSYIMMAPWLLVFLVVTVIPIIASIVLSFTNFNMLQIPKFNGLTNYLRLLLDDDIFIIALKNTLVFVIVVGPIGYLLSFVFAWFINEFNPKLRAILTLTFYTPTLAGSVFFIWKFIFAGDSYGLFNSWLLRLGLIDEPVSWLVDTRYSLNIVILVVLWMSAGAGFLAFIAGLQSLDSELFEAGAIDGVRNRWQELWYIVLPQMKPQLLLGVVFTIGSSYSVGYQSSQLAGFPSTDYSAHTVVLHIQDFGFTRYEMGYASAVSVVLFILMLVNWYLVENALKKWDTD